MESLCMSTMLGEMPMNLRSTVEEFPPIHAQGKKLA